MGSSVTVTCTLCPVGCKLAVTCENGGWRVTGNRCRRGLEYGVNEVRNPTRTLITVIPVDDGELPVVPVKTNKPIPKSRIMEAAKIIANVRAKAPVKLGQPIVRNLLNLKVDLVATKSIKPRKHC